MNKNFKKFISYWIFKIFENINKSKRFRLKLVRSYLRTYLYVIDEVENETVENNLQCNQDIFWTMWLQEERPEIVQLCLNSIEKYCKNLKIITEKNYKDYVDIPKYILDKFYSGKMKPCFFSDYIRVCLLEKYGGTWIDVTCYMTNSVPQHILNSDFFVLEDYDKYTFSNYFIHSKPNNFLIRVIKRFLEEYWKDNDKECYYFFFHTFTLLARKYNKHFKAEWDKMPIGLNYNTKLMYKVLFDNYEPNVFNWLCKTSYLHKLTYKTLNGKNPEDRYEKSLLNYLLKNN